MKIINKRMLILFGLLCFFIGFIFIGPDPIFNINKRIWIMIIAEVIIGLGSAFIFPTMMPEMVDTLRI